MSYARNRDNEDFSEFDNRSNRFDDQGPAPVLPPQQPHYNRREDNLYQRFTEHEGRRRFDRSAEGIPSVSKEDFHILRECNKESFWYRCVPLAVGTTALIYYLAGQKNMRPKVWHVGSAVFGGWFFGKLSYRRVCEDRLVNSNSTSPFVTAMRRRRGIVRDDLNSTMVGDAPPEATDPYWEQQPNAFGGQEFADYRDDNQSKQNEGMDTKPYTSYDDLRTTNRGAYKPRPFTLRE